jgi:hypothetical protein
VISAIAHDYPPAQIFDRHAALRRAPAFGPIFTASAPELAASRRRSGTFTRIIPAASQLA